MMRPGQIGFRRLLDEDEKIVRSFRRPFPLGAFFFHLLLWGGLMYAAGWWFLFDFTQYATLAVMGVPFIIGVYKLGTLFSRWYFNAVLMTTETLVFVDWRRMFDMRMVRLDYWDQDQIVIERTGAMPFLFSYGDLHFTKISGGEPYIFRKINKPRKVARILTKNREVMLDEKNFMEEGALKNLISQMVQTQVRHGGQPTGRRNFPAEEFFSDDQKPRSKREQKAAKKEEKKRKKQGDQHLEIEKQMDDTGGIEIDLD